MKNGLKWKKKKIEEFDNYSGKKIGQLNFFELIERNDSNIKKIDFLVTEKFKMKMNTKKNWNYLAQA